MVMKVFIEKDDDEDNLDIYDVTLVRVLVVDFSVGIGSACFIGNWE